MRFILFFQLFIWFSHLWGILICLNMTHGHNYSWECLNDYLFTIRCELNASSKPQTHDALYWLEFTDDWERFECVLTSQTYPWVCVLNLTSQVEHSFMDVDIFQISLHYSFHGNNGSVVLTTSYMPLKYIRPVPPSDPMLLWKPEVAMFHWLSGYNESIMLVPYLIYQLRIQSNNKVLYVTSHETSVSVPRSTLVPNANYTAHVRSVPHQMFYEGVWSQWSPAVYWKLTNEEKKKGDDQHLSFSRVGLSLILLPVILFCYFSYTRWKRCSLTPSPTPHIGDFKGPLMQSENVGELLHREESLHIDNLSEDPIPTHSERTCHVNDCSGHTTAAGSPRSPGMIQSDVGSKVSMSNWLQVLMSADKTSVMYSDDYCTLAHTMSGHAMNTRTN